MHRFASKLNHVTKTGFHTSSQCLAISRFNLPAMSPTMTEGTIHKWMKKEGDSFSAGEVLLELETDKAQIDVEASEDGVLAKIVLKDGSKAPVNTLIALLAEEGDDISSVEVPAEEGSAAAAAPAQTEEKKEEKPAAVSTPAVSPISHHDIDTSKLKKPLSPAVMSLVLKYGIKDIDSIKGTGNGDRILKGDVLAHLGLIKPKPAPKATLSIAPPRDQIVFAKVEKTEKAVKKEVVPTFISKNIVIDNLTNLRHTLNEQHGTHVSVNDFIAKAAERALQDVSANKKTTRTSTTKPIVYTSTFGEKKYSGGQFKVFHLAEPTYDFITDSYQPSKPYVLSVGKQERITFDKKVNSDNEMVDLIGYLGGEVKKEQPRRIQLGSKSEPLDFTEKRDNYQVQVKLDGFVPGKVLNDKKAGVFLDQVEYYIRNPNELV